MGDISLMWTLTWRRFVSSQTIFMVLSITSTKLIIAYPSISLRTPSYPRGSYIPCQNTQNRSSMESMQPTAFKTEALTSMIFSFFFSIVFLLGWTGFGLGGILSSIWNYQPILRTKFSTITHTPTHLNHHYTKEQTAENRILLKWSVVSALLSVVHATLIIRAM